MTVLHFLMAIFGAWRLTNIIRRMPDGSGEKIFAPIRNLFPKNTLIQTFWGCILCISVWTGGIATVAFYFAPFLMWPFAISFLYLLANPTADWWIVHTQSKMRRGVFFEVFPNGNIKPDWGGFDPKEGVVRLRSALDQIEKKAS